MKKPKETPKIKTTKTGRRIAKEPEGNNTPGQRERAAIRKNEAMRLRAEEGMTLKEISDQIGVSFIRVHQMLEEVRETLNKETKTLAESLRNAQAARYLAVIKQWLPIVLQPVRKSRVQRLREGGFVIEEDLVFNPPAVDAANVLFKAEAGLARLMGLNLEKTDDSGADKEKFLVWINQQINVGGVKSLEDGKVYDTVTKMGKLEIAPEPDQPI